MKAERKVVTVPAEEYEELKAVARQLAETAQRLANASGPKKRRERERRKANLNWKKEKRTCPKCGQTGYVLPNFGVKTVYGNEYPQSYCNGTMNGCRVKAANESHAIRRRAYGGR